jgi:hypothetical protein
VFICKTSYLFKKQAELSTTLWNYSQKVIGLLASDKKQQV